MQTKIKKLVGSALLLAIAMVLSYVKLFSLPLGGSVTLCSMLFVVLIGYFYGKSYGVISAFIYGLLQFVTEPYFFSPLQFMIDYIFAFTSLSFGSIIFANTKIKFRLEKMYFTGVFFRFIFSSLAGIAFYSSYAPEGMNTVLYAVVYNGSYLFSEAVITIILIQIPAFKSAINRVYNSI